MLTLCGAPRPGARDLSYSTPVIFSIVFRDIHCLSARLHENAPFAQSHCLYVINNEMQRFLLADECVHSQLHFFQR